MPHFFIVSGESSGDRLGALLGGELHSQGHQVSGWGGQNMQEAGVHLTQDISQLKVMGWTDVIFSLPKYFNLLVKCKQDISSKSPDAIILIDFGSFNLRIAKWAKNNELKVIYYSPPKIWASRPSRIAQLKKNCDQVIVLFPFEKTYYQDMGLEVEYYGHPFAEQIKSYKANPNFRMDHGLDERPILSIIPGSRSSEIKNTLPTYLEAVENITDHQICVSCAEGQDDIVQKICESASIPVTVIGKQFYDLLSISNIALVTSGTATLEVALFNVPQIVGYRTSWLNYKIAKRLVTVKYISLVNLILSEGVLSELIQDEFNSSNLKRAFSRINEVNNRNYILKKYKEVLSLTYISGGIQKNVDLLSN